MKKSTFNRSWSVTMHNLADVDQCIVFYMCIRKFRSHSTKIQPIFRNFDRWPSQIFVRLYLFIYVSRVSTPKIRSKYEKLMKLLSFRNLKQVNFFLKIENITNVDAYIKISFWGNIIMIGNIGKQILYFLKI